MIKKILLICSLFIFVSNLCANEQKKLEEKFLKTIDVVINIVEDKQLDKDLRNSKIIEELTPIFDFELMAKLSLGRTWKKLSKPDQDKFIKLYVKRMKQSYSSKIDAYSGETIEITQTKQPKSNRIELITNLVSKESKLEISYKFWKPKKQKNGKNSWLIYDVVILGVSILKTDIAQFKEFLQTKTIKELLAELEKK
jgi:phospholipid transport system substrate-binding protein